MWQKFIDIDADLDFGGYPFSMVSAPDGGFVTAGSGNNIFAMKVDNSGEVLWERQIGVELNSFDSRCVIAAPSGRVRCGRLY